MHADPACSLANPLFTTTVQAGVGELLTAGTALDFSAFPRAPAESAPRLGQHTEQVLCTLLGMSTAEFGRLHDQGIVTRPGSGPSSSHLRIGGLRFTDNAAPEGEYADHEDEAHDHRH